MVAVSAMNYFDRSILSVTAPTLIHEFHMSATAMGAAFSAFLVSYTALMTPGGWLADRFGARRVITFAALGWGLFTIVTPLPAWLGLPAATMLALLFGTRFLLGATSAPLYPSCGSLTAQRIAPSRIARVQGIVISASALGSFAAPLIFSRAIEKLGWKPAFLLAGFATWAIAGLWAAGTKDNRATRRVTRKNGGGLDLTLLRNRTLLLLSASYFCLNYFEYIFFYWIYYYFGEVLHASTQVTALASSCVMLGMIVMGPSGGWISDALGARTGLWRARRIVAVGGLALSAALLWAGAAGFGVFATTVLLTLAFGCASASEGPFWASAIAAGKEHAGAAGGLLNTIGNIGGILAPVLTPYIASQFGWQAALWTGSAVVLLGAVAWTAVRAAD